MVNLVLPPLAVSMGEPAGIGPDLLLKLYAERQIHALPPFIVFGQGHFLKSRAERLGLGADIQACSPAEAVEVFSTALPVVEVAGLIPDHPGKPSPVSASAVITAIADAVKATMTGACRGLITAPIHKGVLYGAGFAYPGHTEYLAALCAEGGVPRRPVMMLAHEDLRAVPLTIHEPLSKVPSLITTQTIVETVGIVAHDLRTRFGIAEPRIAVAGLNPHAGEGGNIGREEVEIIGPAIAKAGAPGVTIEGPLPADTVFHPAHWRRFDAVIAMYHDQALIPIKALAFESAVNITLGLPIVRTSPDHGTAFDLAGSGTGSAESLLAAIRCADRLTGRH